MRIAFIIYSHSLGGAEFRYYNVIRNFARKTGVSVRLYTIPKLLGELELRGGKLPDNVEIVPLFPNYVLPLFDWLDFSIYQLSPILGNFGVKGLRYLSLKFTRSFQKFFYKRVSDVDIVHSVFLSGMPRKFEDNVQYVLSVVYTRADQLYRSNKNFSTFIEKGGGLEVLSEDILTGLIQGNVIDPEKVHYAVAPCSFIDYGKCAVGEKKKIISFCGRLEAIKNPEMFVRACIEVAKLKADYIFNVMGDGPIRSTIQALIDDSGYSDRFTVGHSKDPTRTLSESEIFVSCQSVNNYPSQSLIEALACGCKVVATNVGETYKLVDKHSGVLVDEDYQSLADGMMKLIDRSEEYDAAEIRERVMESHTADRYSDHLHRLYKETIARGRGREGNTN